MAQPNPTSRQSYAFNTAFSLVSSGSEFLAVFGGALQMIASANSEDSELNIYPGFAAVLAG